MKTAKRIGPRMLDVVNLVRQMPGCTKFWVAKRVGPHGSLFYGYNSVNRAIKAGLIRADDRGTSYALYVM